MSTEMEPAEVTLLTSHLIGQESEEHFRAWVGRVTDAASTFPGHLGDGLFRSTEGIRTWVLIHRFRDHESAHEWMNSPERAALFDGGEADHRSDSSPRELSGMETWCTSRGDATTVVPPRWKMALAAFAAILPISLVGNGLLGPIMSALPLLARVLILAMLFSTLMTYLMMPTVTSILRRWLYPGRERAGASQA